MKFKDNLKCVNCELSNWDYDRDGLTFPIAYELTFKFHGTDVIANVTTKELQKDSLYVEFVSVETDGDLSESFKEVFEANEFKDKVKTICKNCWENNLNSDGYNYKGLKS